MPDETTVAEHYDRMIDEIDDPAHHVTDSFFDEGLMRAWMEYADGPAFFAAMGDVRDLRVLEVGVGTGRVAKKLLDLGCAALTGLDISAKSLERARRNLGNDPRVELLLVDILDFDRPDAFDRVYCAWSFFHIADQPRALARMAAALKPGGRLVLSLEEGDEWLDYGPRVIRQYPIDVGAVGDRLSALGCRVEPPVPECDAEGVLVTTVVSATRI
jgi:ubiquinone/menaquinone biosynthesis C-methylase UbiE